MKKIYLKELEKELRKCGIGTNCDEINLTPVIIAHHNHNWDHGYERWNGINVYENGSYDNGQGYKGTRREFYLDFFDVIKFLMEYINYNEINELIIAPFYRYYQFSFNNKYKDNDIYSEIYSFLRYHNIRRGEHSGVKLLIENNQSIIEMITEGAFRGISELCIFFPSQKVLLAPNHHFGLAFFTQNIELEKKCINKLIKKHHNIRIFINR